MNIPSRTTLIVGNWKMYKTIAETEEFISSLIPLVKESTAVIYLSVPFTAIKSASDKCQGTNIHIGAQNMNDASEGAFTGEIAAKMILEAGGTFVILGHSERRNIFNESNELINKKIKKSFEEGLTPILCIGESKEDHQNKKTQEILKNQLFECLKDISIESLPHLIIAYEPVWAIGSGETPSPEEVQEIHAFIRQLLSELSDQPTSLKIPILYGGSINPQNAGLMIKEHDVDGLLVGGASLSPESFSQIVNYQNALTY